MQALALTPLSFLRPFGLLCYSVLTCCAGSPRAKARVWQDKYMFFGQDVRPADQAHACDVQADLLAGRTAACTPSLGPAHSGQACGARRFRSRRASRL